MPSPDFSKPWHRDAHLPKLDARLLPALKLRLWTAEELSQYCREEGRNQLLDAHLVERWLTSAEERSLARRCSGDRRGAAVELWGATERGQSRGSFGASVFQQLGGLPGAVGIVSFAIAVCADRISPSLRPLVVITLIYLVALLAAVLIGRVAAERSKTLLRKVAEREALVRPFLEEDPVPVGKSADGRGG